MKESYIMVYSKLFQASACLLLSGALAFAAPLAASAKPGGGGSSGSRGTRTQSAPAATPTAPKPAAPIERTATPAPAAPSTATPAAAIPAAARAPQAAPAAAAAAAKPRFGTGMMAGLLGAGLMGAVLGAGFSGGLGGIMSFIGMFMQMALLAGIVFFVVRWFRNRSTPATAGANSNTNSSSNTMRRDAVNLGGSMGNAAPRAAPRPETNRPVQINPADFAFFEKLLGDVQANYSADDMNALRNITTPEMASYFAEELSDNAKKGWINRITDVKLLQGDLSESWGEPGVDYATVAMRFALTDVMLERDSNKQVASYNNGKQEATELWTFIRPVAGSWKLSAIQQAS
jgi:predicted lipid-binding transport protein (Tim44 family)